VPGSRSRVLDRFLRVEPCVSFAFGFPCGELDGLGLSIEFGLNFSLFRCSSMASVMLSTENVSVFHGLVPRLTGLENAAPMLEDRSFEEHWFIRVVLRVPPCSVGL
jgi:hypothetical protein